jgi:hypothetical protein
MTPDWAITASTIFGMALGKTQRNLLLLAVVNGGLAAADCSLGEIDKPLAPVLPSYRISHEPTQSFILFNGPGPDSSYAVRRKLGDDPQTTLKANDFGHLRRIVQAWARAVVNWQGIPDLWTVMAGGVLPEANENNPFSQQERDEIANRLDEIKHYAGEQFELTAEQMRATEESLDYLKDAAERVGRKDWRVMFYGAFVSLGLEHAVSSGVVETMLRLAVQGLGHIFGAASPPMITA